MEEYSASLAIKFVQATYAKIQLRKNEIDAQSENTLDQLILCKSSKLA